MTTFDIETLLTKSQADIFSLIGKELKPIGFAFDERTEKEKEIDGRNWYAKHKEKLLQKICNDEAVQKRFLKKNNFNTLELVAALVDLVSLVTTGISPALIAMIIVKNGIEAVCKPYINNE